MVGSIARCQCKIFLFFFILYMRTFCFDIAVRTAEVRKKPEWLNLARCCSHQASTGFLEVDGSKQDHFVDFAGTWHDISFIPHFVSRMSCSLMRAYASDSLRARQHSAGVCVCAPPPRNTTIVKNITTVNHKHRGAREKAAAKCLLPRAESRIRESTKRSSHRTKSISSPAAVCTR
jgi:hypothetical protein